VKTLTRNKASTKKRASRVVVERGSGNPFADLGLPNADERLVKAKLAFQIAQAIEASGLSQTAAAERLGIDQPKVSNIVRGRLAGFSIDRLFRLLNELGRDVSISVTPSNHGHGEVSVMAYC
jgi:predicted XRE-type DNA-binding protein